jgi:hypothetical protein
MGTMSDRVKAEMARELAWIGDPKIVEFVLQCFDAVCPETFWVRPASTSGKYHPDVSLGDGGLLRHTKLAAYWANELARSMDGTGKGRPVHQDVLVAAALLHDVMKDGDPDLAHLPERFGNRGHGYIVGCHGIDMANAILRKVFGSDPRAMTRQQMLILYGVACHMGVWTNVEAYRPQNIEDDESRMVANIVHLADYCASRKVDAYLQTLVKPAACESVRDANGTQTQGVGQTAMAAESVGT